MGPVDRVAVQVVAGHMEGLMGLPTKVAPPLPEPDYALIPSRRQYDVSKILKAFTQDVPANSLRLALTAVDLCLPMLSHVFGQAQVGGRVMVISTHRLGGRGGEPGGLGSLERSYDRLAKIAIHETGHVLGVRHCRVRGCVMNFSLELEHLDGLEMSFCPECWINVLKGIARVKTNG